VPLDYNIIFMLYFIYFWFIFSYSIFQRYGHVQRRDNEEDIRYVTELKIVGEEKERTAQMKMDGHDRRWHEALGP